MVAMFGVGVFELIIVSGVLAFVAAFVVAMIVVSTKKSSFGQMGNPNLRPCPDCGQLISVRAASCPHCGGPVKGV